MGDTPDPLAGMDPIISTAPPPKPEPTTAKVKVITSLKPWANGRPLELDEVVVLPIELARVLEKNRHAVIVG